jgi:hypothetical protein
MDLTIKSGTRTSGGACGLIMGSKSYSILMEIPPVANGAEISRIEGFVKMQKSNEEPRRLGKISIFLQDRLK